MSRKRGAAAVDLVRRARAERPDDARLAAVCNAILSRELPPFHRGMLLDTARNGTFARGIAAMAPGKLVLDIGTGSGLLAMLAARAGAAHVYACEENPMLAETAREIIAANGFADRITVFARSSEDLDPVDDLGGGVDLIVSEVISENLFGEGILRTLEDARSRLCLPGARFLPARVTVRAALADAQPPPPIGSVEGLDLSLFERHLRPGGFINVAPARDRQRGEPIDFLTLEFAGDEPIGLKGEVLHMLPSPGGQIGGVLQWLRIETAPGITYENVPGGDPSLSWLVRYIRFARPVQTQPGDTVAVGMMYSGDEVVGWLADDDRPSGAD